MNEVFDELVKNSIHWFDKDEREICVVIERIHKKETPPDLDSSERYLKIMFKDNGEGIPISNKDKIFAPFYSTYPHGTGLGLAIIKYIIEAHGGTIYERGNYKEGAEFVIFLPLAKVGEEYVQHSNS